MPSRLPTGQPSGPIDHALAWFDSTEGKALISSETDSIRAALNEREGQPWLWLAPTAGDAAGAPAGRGLRLQAAGTGWVGPVRCDVPLPLANETVATIVIQHAAKGGSSALVGECARVLVPGGRLWLYSLNPLSPYRLRWYGWGLAASEPMPWRRRLRAAGLQPDPVSQGLGPRWRVEVSAAIQQGPGLRAAWVLRAEKRSSPLTPIRPRVPLRLGDGVPAA